jgi:hypothetical protein
MLRSLGVELPAYEQERLAFPQLLDARDAAALERPDNGCVGSDDARRNPEWVTFNFYSSLRPAPAR